MVPAAEADGKMPSMFHLRRKQMEQCRIVLELAWKRRRRTLGFADVSGGIALPGRAFVSAMVVNDL